MIITTDDVTDSLVQSYMADRGIGQDEAARQLISYGNAVHQIHKSGDVVEIRNQYGVNRIQPFGTTTGMS